MPEAVIVSTARSPIGRAFKGSLKDVRPDDLTAQIIQAALAKVPELDPRDIDDLMLGCGLPGGEQGFNMGRVVAVLLGMDHLPGCTITRYCSSSLQTTRMALHAIRAGEGDVFISAGVETVSRTRQGQLRRPAGHARTRCSPRPRRAPPSDRRHDRRAGLDRPARERPGSPTSTSRWARRPRTWPSSRASAAQEQDEFGVRSQNLAEKAIADGFWAREITPVTTARRHRGQQGRRPARRRHAGGGRRPQAGLPPRRHGHRRQLLPAERRRGGRW